MNKEFIVCSALDFQGNIICGLRHSDCYSTIELLIPNISDNELPNRDKTGFLTSTNRFVDRKEAWIIAIDNNQIKYGLEASDNDEESILISENLY